MRRVNVVGTSCAGKTTLAKSLAHRLGIPHVEFDALHWEPGWRAVEPAVFRERVSRALEADAWVACGNAKPVQDIVWERADTVVWLDYSLPRVLSQWARRTLRRAIRREVCCNGNRETLIGHFVGKDALFFWILTTWHRRRRTLPISLAEWPHLRVIRLGSPRETRRWLGTLETHRPSV